MPPGGPSAAGAGAPAAWWRRGGLWGVAAVVAALVPFAGGFSLSRIFFVRDLGLFFWERHTWFRRSLFSGEWPLWDPYLAGGQSAAADALHQMFLLPVLAVRMIGSEVVGFNLWVALPFPLAALGAYLFFRSRFTPAAASVGAAVFSLAGPTVSTATFPNMSWSVAALPWVLWAADRCHGPRLGARVAVLGLAVAFQAAAGEPVSLAATVAVALAMSVVVGSPDGASGWRPRLQSLAATAGGVVLGGCIAAVQLLPLSGAVADSWRPFIRLKDYWSFHPLSLVETVAPNLFGDFFHARSFDDVPWVGALNGSREPFFSSVYAGPAAVALAAFGLARGWRRAWTGFWGTILVAALLAALGGHTPAYPFVRDLLPLVGSFRFPVKYLVVAGIALAALAACAWDAIERRDDSNPVRYRRACVAGVLVPALVGVTGWMASAAAIYFPTPTARWIYDAAIALGVKNPIDATAYMLHAIAGAMTRVLLWSAAVSVLVAVAAGRRPQARFARHALYALLVVDLLYGAWGIDPTADVGLLKPEPWVNLVAAHPDSRFYFGGKMAGKIEISDRDAPRDYTVSTPATPMETRSVFGQQIVMFPAGSGAREMLSYDLAVLWPRIFEQAHVRFARADPAERERFLDRCAVRFRVLPEGRGGGRPGLPAGGFVGVRAYDWGPGVTRAFVVPGSFVVSDEAAELGAMFADSWDSSKTTMLRTPPGAPDGTAGAPVEAAAHIVRDRANSLLVEAGVGAGGGYLVLADSWSPDWRVRVDGRDATLYRANLLFRAVRLVPGRHQVEFFYQPRLVLYGGLISLAGLAAALVLAFKVRGGGRP
jgi:hypothetical protein